MKKLKDPCELIPTEAGKLFLTKVKAGKFITNNSVSSVLHNIQNDLNAMAAQLTEGTESVSDYSAQPDIQSEDGQSSLGIPGSDDSD